jgi:hypothetical protein
MNIFLRTLFLSSLLLSSLSQSAEIQVAKQRISLYQVELVCPAVSEIGCGSAAKPLLMELERDPHIDEAWLNRAGTIVAVVWKETSPKKQRFEIVQSALKKVRELKGEAREQGLKGFLSGNGWYRGAAVDRLSEEEASVISARLVRKMGHLVVLPDEKAKALQQGFTAVLTRKLTKGEPDDESQTYDQLLNICREHLDEKDIVILQQAHDKGAFSHLRDQ